MNNQDFTFWACYVIFGLRGGDGCSWQVSSWRMITSWHILRSWQIFCTRQECHEHVVAESNFVITVTFVTMFFVTYINFRHEFFEDVTMFEFVTNILSRSSVVKRWTQLLRFQEEWAWYCLWLFEKTDPYDRGWNCNYYVMESCNERTCSRYGGHKVSFQAKVDGLESNWTVIWVKMDGHSLKCTVLRLEKVNSNKSKCKTGRSLS